MERNRFGDTDLMVSPLCYGTYTLSGAWAQPSPRDADIVRYCYDRGINFFDTAFAYGGGLAEETLARGLGDLGPSRRDDVVLVTKGGLAMQQDGGGVSFVRDSSPKLLRESLHRSLRRLNTDYVDVYLIHWFDPSRPIEEAADAMKSFVDEGLARYIGVSNYTVEQMRTFSSVVDIDVAQVPYNLFAQYTEDEILPYCLDNGVGVMGYAAVAQGYLTGRFTDRPEFAADDWRTHSPEFTGEVFDTRMRAVRELETLAEQLGCTLAQLAVAWTRHHAAGVVPVVSTRSTSHLDANLHALAVEISDEAAAAAQQIGRRVTQIDYAKVAPV